MRATAPSRAVVAARVLLALLINAVPLLGFLGHGWSVGTVLLLFWWENLLGVGAAGALWRRHERHSGDPVYADPSRAPRIDDGRGSRPMRPADFLSTYLVLGIAHGAVLAVMLLVFANELPAQAGRWWPQAGPLGVGGALLLLLAAVDFASRWRGTPQLAYAALQAQVEAHGGRALVLHFTLVLGCFAAAALASPTPVIALLVACKASLDVRTVLRTRI